MSTNTLIPDYMDIKKSTKRLSKESVKKYIENEGHILLSDIYINNNSKLDIICPKGHHYHKTFSHFKRGQRCPHCNLSYKLTYEYVKNYIENNGYKLLSNTYKNNYTHLNMICPEGHICKITYSNFEQGYRCHKCRDDKRRYTYDDVKKYIENRGFKLLSDMYINNKTRITIKCPNGHTFKPRFDNFKNSNTECPLCKRLKSKPELEIVTYLKSMYNGNIIENDRSVIKNPLTGKMLELDIFLPELHKAIEYNGSYWHSCQYSKFKDKEKMKQCKENNIQLLVLKESNWKKEKEYYLNRVKNFIEA